MLFRSLPMDQYAEKGLLKDLTGLFDEINMLPGLKKAMQTANGQIYAMPAQFAIDLLWGNQDLIAQVTSLADLAQAQLENGKVPFSPRSAQDWLKLLFPANMPALRDASGIVQFNNEQFATLLTTLQSLYEKQGEMPLDTLVEGAAMQTEILSMLNGASAFMVSRFDNTMSASISYTVSGAETADCAPMPTLDGQSKGLIPSLMMGISAQSENQELAQAFIALVLSEEIQVAEGDGLPALSKVLDVLFEEAIEMSKNENMRAMLSFGGTPIEMKQADERILNHIRELINLADERIVEDQTLIGFITEESAGFFENGGDAMAVADAVQQRAWSYLNE